MDTELERARRAYAARGGVEEASRVLARLLRGAGPAAACAWLERQVGALDARGRTWLLHDEAARLARVHDRRTPGEARLVEGLLDLSRAVRGEWPVGRDPHFMATVLEAWRRMLPVVNTGRLTLGGLFLAGMVDDRTVAPVRADFNARLDQALAAVARTLARELGFDRGRIDPA